MASTLNDTIGSAKSAAESAQRHARKAMGAAIDSAKEGTEHASSTARSTWWDGVKAVTGLLTVVRSFQPADALAWIGLSRRRSPFLSLGIFGAGIAIGAGAGVLFAPMSGTEMRRRVRGRFARVKQGAERPVGRGESEVKSVVENVPVDAKSHVSELHDVVGKSSVPSEHNEQDGAPRWKNP